MLRFENKFFSFLWLTELKAQANIISGRTNDINFWTGIFLLSLAFFIIWMIAASKTK